MHTSEKPGPVVCVQIRNLVVHDVAARFPKRLARNDFPGCLTLQLKADPALHYISENRPGVAMRRDSGVSRWEFEELRHRVRTLGNGGGNGTEEIRFLDVSVTQHGHLPLIDTSLPRIASRASIAPTDHSEFRQRILH